MKSLNSLSVITGLLCFSSIQLSNAAEHVLYDAAKIPANGTVITKTSEMAMKNCVITMEMQGQKMNGTMSRTGEKIEVVTHDSDTQITVVYKKDSAVGTVEMMGQKQPATEEKEILHGKTVILTKAEGKWTGKLKEGEATEAQKEKIKDIADDYNGNDNDAEIYGTAPRKVGDTWNVDPTKIDSFGKDDDKLKGTFKMTFKGVEKFQGEDCALLVADVDVTGPTGDGDATMNFKAKATIYRSLKNQVDLKNDMTGTMTMSGTVNQGMGKMTMVGPMSISMKSEVKLP